MAVIQRTISFNPDLMGSLIIEWDKWCAENDLTITFSEFVCSKLRKQMKNDITPPQ